MCRWGKRKMVAIGFTALTALSVTAHAAAQTTTSSLPYSTPNRGSMSIEPTGRPAGSLVGYARLQPTASTAPSGAAIFGFRQNGILVTETSVPGMTTTTSGRTYAEANGSINTGVAFVNPGGLPLTIAFNFTDPTGNDFDRGNLTLNGNAQIAKFLTESPFNMRAGFAGA